ncbi:hypothetical protein, partial [Sinomicrobium weinanense]
MKKIILFSIAILLGQMSVAQRSVQKEVAYKGQHIHIEVKFADSIVINTWDKPTVSLQAEIMTRGGKHLDAYELETKETTNTIHINSKPERIFDKFRSECDCNTLNTDYKAFYSINIPKNAQFEISSINGDLQSKIIEGNFTAELINGNIGIENYSGQLNLSTINGEIDLEMKNTSLTLETIHGNVFARENLELETEERVVGH